MAHFTLYIDLLVPSGIKDMEGKPQMATKSLCYLSSANEVMLQDSIAHPDHPFLIQVVGRRPDLEKPGAFHITCIGSNVTNEINYAKN